MLLGRARGLLVNLQQALRWPVEPIINENPLGEGLKEIHWQALGKKLVDALPEQVMVDGQNQLWRTRHQDTVRWSPYDAILLIGRVRETIERLASL